MRKINWDKIKTRFPSNLDCDGTSYFCCDWSLENRIATRK